VSFPENDYRAPHIPTSPGPTGPLYVQSGPQTYGQQFTPQYPPTGGFQLPPPKKRRSALAIVLWSILGVLVLVVGIGVVGALAANTAKTPTAATTTAGRPAAEQPAAPTPAKTYPTPALTDFALAVKVTKKQCFGSAGCNVEFTIDLAYNGPALEPNSSWDVTFDLQGTEDSYTSTLHMTVNDTGLHGTYDQDSDQLVQTKSAKTVLKPVVTSVTAAS
jgi:hypothetical protein